MEFNIKTKKSTIINITSLIDVLFLLLIFMMVSSTFIEQPGIKLDLPETTDAPSVKKSKYILSVSVGGELYLNDKPVNMKELENELRAILETIEDDTLLLKGDTDIPYGKIVKIMDIVKKSGLKKLVIVTRQNSTVK